MTLDRTHRLSQFKGHKVKSKALAQVRGIGSVGQVSGKDAGIVYSEPSPSSNPLLEKPERSTANKISVSPDVKPSASDEEIATVKRSWKPESVPVRRRG